MNTKQLKQEDLTLLKLWSELTIQQGMIFGKIGTDGEGPTKSPTHIWQKNPL